MKVCLTVTTVETLLTDGERLGVSERERRAIYVAKLASLPHEQPFSSAASLRSIHNAVEKLLYLTRKEGERIKLKKKKKKINKMYKNT